MDCLYRSKNPPLGWSRARDGSILKQLAKHHDATEIAAAIQGLPILQRAGTIGWLGTGPMTLRAIYATGSGVRTLFGQAVDAFHKSQDTKAPAVKGEKRQPLSVAAVMADLMQKVGA